MQEYASTSQLHLSKTSCHDSKSFSKLPPENLTCKSIPQLHSLPYPRLLVTIPSHFLKLPPENPTCKSMPQLHSLPSPRLLVLEPKSFSKPPPRNLTCKRMPPCHESKSFFKPSPPKTLHARVFLNFTASPIQDFLSRFQGIF